MRQSSWTGVPVAREREGRAEEKGLGHALILCAYREGRKKRGDWLRW